MKRPCEVCESRFCTLLPSAVVSVCIRMYNCGYIHTESTCTVPRSAAPWDDPSCRARRRAISRRTFCPRIAPSPRPCDAHFTPEESGRRTRRKRRVRGCPARSRLEWAALHPCRTGVEAARADPALLSALGCVVPQPLSTLLTLRSVARTCEPARPCR